mmetsp:Transcript_11776/g.22631  ORF Transcript_11776/g.22631 Transcript_11776/m.22631 type:complete len:223 (-) Transcript_11776:385-1053(-)
MELVHIVWFRKDFQIHLFSRRTRGVGILDTTEFAHDGGKEIGRLWERITPHGVVTSTFVGHRTLVDQVAIGQQDGIRVPVGFETDPTIRGHVIGPIGKVRDASETQRLALRTVHGPRLVQSRELRIVFGDNFHHGFQCIAIFQVHQKFHVTRFQHVIGVLGQRLAIELNGLQRDTGFIAIQNDLVVVHAGRRWILFPHHGRFHDGFTRADIKLHFDLIDRVG